jgi:thiol:disulfide interchange protein
LNTWKTKQWVERQGVVVLKADKSRPAPDADELLVELGNAGRAIPYVAIYPATGGPPITLAGPITQGRVLEALRQAGPSKGA